MQESLPSFISTQITDGSYFFKDLNPEPETRFALVCGGIERCARDYRIERQRFQYWGIEYVISGRARLRMGDKDRVIRPGSLFGYGPETEFSLEAEREEPLTKCFIDVSGCDAAALFSGGPFGRGEVVEFAGSQWIERAFRELIRCGIRGGARSDRRSRLLAEDLLLAAYEGGVEVTTMEVYSRGNYKKCLAIIEEKYDTLGSIAELARTVNLDQAYVSRLFKRYDEEAPYKKLIRLKMNRAAQMLMGGRYAVKEVAAVVGFSDPAHFSRVFKRVFGVSPKLFPATVGRA